MTDMECVYVEWEDASAVDEVMGWVLREGAGVAEPHFFRQVGFVHSIDFDCVVLTEAYNQYSMAPRTRIPLGMIRRWVYLDHIVAPKGSR